MTDAPSARLFVAIDPPGEVREALAAWARAAVRALGLRQGQGGPVRLLESELLHVTLCFLGERPLGEIAAIEEALAASAAPVGELRVGAPLWLPARRPRALAVEICDSGGDDGAAVESGAREGSSASGERLQALHDTLLVELARARQLPREPRRRFRAHVTVARLRGGDRRRGHPSTQAPLPATPARTFTPAEIVLYRSWLSPAGASYEALASRTLAPA